MEFARVLSNGVTRTVDRREYEHLIETAEGFTWLVDARDQRLGDGRATVYQEGREAGRLTLPELQVLEKLIRNPGIPYEPQALPPDRRDTKTIIAQLNRARRLCEPPHRLGRVETKNRRTFKTHGRGEGNVRYSFDPPRNFKYCLIIPPAARRAEVGDASVAGTQPHGREGVAGMAPGFEIVRASTNPMFRAPMGNELPFDEDELLAGPRPKPLGIRLAHESLTLAQGLEFHFDSPFVAGRDLMLPVRMLNLTGKTKVIRRFVLDISGQKYAARPTRRSPRRAGSPKLLSGQLLSIAPRKVVQGLLTFKHPAERGDARVEIEIVGDAGRSGHQPQPLPSSGAPATPPPRQDTPARTGTSQRKAGSTGPSGGRGPEKSGKGRPRLKKPSR